MKVVVRLVDKNNERITIDGRTIMPNVENTLKKTETVDKAIRQGILKFVRNIEVKLKKDKPVNSKPLSLETKSPPENVKPKKSRRKKKATGDNSND